LILTKRQSDILGFIQKVLLNNGYPPTLREIAAHFKIKSSRTVFDHVVSLEKKGYVKRDRGKNRGLRIVKMPGLPLLGEISAGSPMVPLEMQEFVGIDTFIDRNHLLLKVKGNSMIDDGIRDKDIIVVRPQKVVKNGEIVACIVEGEVLVKRFEKKGDEIRLKPANKEMEPLIIKEKENKKIEIIGKVVALLRTYA
jgi:repressor LexA